MKSKKIDTARHLLVTYDTLALDFKKRRKPDDGIYSENKLLMIEPVKAVDYNNYNYTFALITMNAAIVEGLMRSILSSIVREDVEKRISDGLRAGQTERSPIENLLKKFYIDIDSSGGWDKLKEHYATYLAFSIDNNLTNDVKAAMKVLFMLRNIFAHGTDFIYPSQNIPDVMRDEPIFKWQSRAQGAKDYLEKEFGHSEVFDNLAEYQLSEHFFNKTKEFFSQVAPKLRISSQQKETLEIIDRSSWGFRNHP